MTLSDVLATPLLRDRLASEAKSRQTRSVGPEDGLEFDSLEAIAERARQLCGAQSSGISVFRRREVVESRWLVATGVMSEYAGSGFPLRHSLCGVAAELGATQLFVKPQRYFKWIEHTGVYISEGLVTPLKVAEGRCCGTLWVMSHRGSRPRFDLRDAEELEKLGARAAIMLLQNYPTDKVQC